MRILVVGASQGTGALAVQEALAQGHQVTAFARSPQKLKIENPKLTKHVGDFHKKESVLSAMKGHDAVIVTASVTSLSQFKQHPQYFSQGTLNVIEAMKETGVKKLVVLSALGTGESRSLSPKLVQWLFIDWILKIPFADHAVQEEMVRKSGLDWVIARPGRLTNGPSKNKYLKKSALEKVPASISRADVANFLVEGATTSTWNGKSVQIGG
jgi:uncharacterized protein YbjT (DUF2867 family)